jgi:L-Ala-D/L-Glu epimerase
LKCGELGIKQIKIKVGTGDDYGRVAAVRDALGDSVSLRVDANGAFDVRGAIALVSSIQPLQIACIEQPVPRGDLNALVAVKGNSPIPVMADESLITEQDAVELVARNACDHFNLRISKNGGVYKTLRLAEMARRAGIGFQLGCQVGETAILSAAGRHVAAHLKGVKFVEGSYGTLLLEEDIAPVRFGYAGKAALLSGSGLGIQVREDTLEKYAGTTAKVEME